MPRQTRSSRPYADAETAATISNFMSWAVLPTAASEIDPLASHFSRVEGLQCLEALPLYEDLAAAVAERNACEKLYSKTEEMLKGLDAKVQIRLNAIQKFKSKKRQTGYGHE
jgi:hypothetical protein